MTKADREKWDKKYAERQPKDDAVPDRWLVECCEDIAPGRALDVACGLGHNAIWLADRGWQVDAVDISHEGLNLASRTAEHRGVSVNWICADLDDWTPVSPSYDLISVFRFLDRDRLPGLVAECLAPNGRLCYETFSSGQLDRADNHLKSARFVLRRGELEQLYSGLEILRSEEIETADAVLWRLLACNRPSGWEP